MNKLITILPSASIDVNKWDECVSNAQNGLIYSSSRYLNYMADNWEGLIVNDYEAVMAIPFRRKFGIKYTYDVPFMQQLGLISNANYIDMLPIMKEFFKTIRYGDYRFNYDNEVNLSTKCTNFVLPLSADIETLLTPSALQSLKRGSKHLLTYQPASIQECVSQYANLYAERVPHITNTILNKFRNLCEEYEVRGELICRKLVDKANKTHAIILLIRDNKRIYNLINGVLPDGRDKEANYLLFYSVFKEFAESQLLFDFEGSDLPTVAAFYKKFNPRIESYPVLHFNRLPWPLKILKK